METWRWVPGYKGKYEVSNLGRVYSHFRQGRMLRPGRTPSGHVSVALGRNNSRFVHELVLLAFRGARPYKHEARHLNGAPGDNRLSNLVWATRTRNSQDKKWHEGQTNYKLSPGDVRRIRKLHAAGSSYRALGRLYGVRDTSIRSAVLRKNHADVK